ncbi:MAG: homocysteine S-methyltransferase family protein [Proteobacteria bacterium]|nr:homocysteine S-methyltransferase family protein [Pseudomonadota bacterium]
MPAEFRKRAEMGAVIFDGAMGTMLDAHGSARPCNESLNIEDAEAVARVHREYLAAGAEVIITNTFGASRVALAEHGLSGRVREINLAAAAIARREADAAGGARFVAGELGPTSKLPTLGHIPHAELYEAYLEQALALAEGGVDLFITSTSQDPLQVKAALAAVMEAKRRKGLDLPVVVSVTVEPSGTMLLGTEILAALAAAAPFSPIAFGINCATGPAAMEEQLHALAASSPFLIVCQPNAGMPENVEGRPVYSMGPEEFAGELGGLIERFGISFAGGCCGTTPAHIAALAGELKGRRSKFKVQRSKAEARAFDFVSSLFTAYPLDQEPRPFIVAEQTNANGSRKFRDLVLAGEFDAMADVARGAAQSSHALDLCVAYAGRDEAADLSRAVGRIAVRADAAIMIDSTDPGAIEAALSRAPGRSIINSINLEDGGAKAGSILSLARRFGAAVVCLCIDEHGMAKGPAEKLEVAERLVDMAEGAGLSRGDLLIDPLTFTLASGDPGLRTAGAKTLEALSLIKRSIPGVRTILGVSNISFGLPAPARAQLTSAFLDRALKAGLDAAIINPARIVPLDRIPERMRSMLDRLIDGDFSNGDPLAEVIRSLSADAAPDEGKARGGAPLSSADALAQRVIEGSRDDIARLVDDLLSEMPAREIVNRVLLPAMQRVGEEFGAGRTPLPFVLASAEAMRAAIDLLAPHMSGGEASHRATIVLATVRGDVHDIGKDLVDAILANNGFRVVNLGIRQPAAAVIAAAREHKADAIGLSGLLVSSTEVMREDLCIFREAGLNVPVLCGGAALTGSFVKGRLSPAYGGRVAYCPDAFAGLREMEIVAKGLEAEKLRS